MQLSPFGRLGLPHGGGDVRVRPRVHVGQTPGRRCMPKLFASPTPRIMCFSVMSSPSAEQGSWRSVRCRGEGSRAPPAGWAGLAVRGEQFQCAAHVVLAGGVVDEDQLVGVHPRRDACQPGANLLLRSGERGVEHP
ncbi:hypothetical protein RKD24_000620 [Streptomyces calvus]